jgi:hypothetical protein
MPTFKINLLASPLLRLATWFLANDEKALAAFRKGIIVKTKKQS